MSAGVVSTLAFTRKLPIQGRCLWAALQKGTPTPTPPVALSQSTLRHVWTGAHSKWVAFYYNEIYTDQKCCESTGVVLPSAVVANLELPGRAGNVAGSVHAQYQVDVPLPGVGFAS